MVTLTLQEHFDALHRNDPDPWHVTDRWYEQRKRDLLMACLPRRHYRRILELGCSTGVGTEALAARSDEVIAVDFSPAAVDRAQQRLADIPHVQLLTSDITAGLPTGAFDLVVVSEVGYYLTPAELDHLFARIRQILAADGQLLICHWQHQADDFRQPGADVHRRALSHPWWYPSITHTEEHFWLHVLSLAPTENGNDNPEANA